MNTLDAPIITTLGPGRGSPVRHTLPGVFAALTREEIADFPALRPHQRHVWHAFLVQVAALAILKAGLDAPPADEEAWRAALLRLTPDHPDGAAWSLITPPDQPALLQPPVPGGDLSGFKPVETPDMLDMLVTSKNHDLKAARLTAAQPEHWLFALISLQTQEGFLGAGNYGISRMNGGFASRPGFGVEPPGGPSARFRRDISRLLRLRGDILSGHDFPSQGGIGLLWLLPWDGATSLSMRDLDPFYVEICRRVRLLQGPNEHIYAVTSGSKSARIESKAFNGNTGDPWTPLIPDGDGKKAFTLDAGGFGYKRLTRLLFPQSNEKGAAQIAPLQQIDDHLDEERGLAILARALVRGQGKTEGFHERRVPVSKAIRRLRREQATDHIAQCAHHRIEDAGQFARKVLYPGVLAVYTGAPGEGERRRDDDTAKARTSRVLGDFDRLVDLDFFEDLDDELTAFLENPEMVQSARGRWLFKLRDQGRDVLESAIRAAPNAAMRHWRVQVKARDIFEGCFAKQFRTRIPDDVWTQHTQRAADPAAHEEQNAQTALPMEADHDA